MRVLDPANSQCLHAIVAGDAAQVGPEAFLDIRGDEFCRSLVLNTQWKRLLL